MADVPRSPCARRAPVPTRPALALLVAVLAGAPLVGCEALGEAGVPGMSRFIDHSEEKAEEEEHRRRFAADGNPEDVRWLLANRVGNGMSVDEVEQVLGQPALREYADGWLKNGSAGRFQREDESYRWGPDSTGRVYYLVFREDQLVNFDPSEYR